ncbi:MAG TPA: hypothetical protein VI699_01580 [Candidatus Acidoferrales bacterium]|nr:hypothetical protein [Candidatus Acidoferrales bacterium]
MPQAWPVHVMRFGAELHAVRQPRFRNTKSCFNTVWAVALFLIGTFLSGVPASAQQPTTESSSTQARNELLLLSPPAMPGTANSPARNELSNKPMSRPRGAEKIFWPVEGYRHRFFDRTNVILFSGVGAARALDFASTRHFRAHGRSEGLLNNDIVDNKPQFVAIEAASTAASIGVAYLFHRIGQHKLERWTSFVHITVGTAGAVRNYRADGFSPSVVRAWSKASR